MAITAQSQRRALLGLWVQPGGEPPPAAPDPPGFVTGQLTTLKHNNSFTDFVESAGYVLITEGKEHMRLFDPFESRVISLDHIKPVGTPILTAIAVGSPGLDGQFFYAVTVANRSLKDQIESAPIRITAGITVTNANVRVDLSTLSRIWSEATHFAIYRSLESADSVDPFPFYARVGIVQVGISPLEFVDSTPDADLDFANLALNIAKGPPPVAPFIQELKSVVFATGVESLRGSNAAVTNGSATVLITDSRLDRIHIGSEISFGSSERGYFILEFQAGSPDDTMTLGDEFGQEVQYEGTTGTKDWFLCADPTEVRYSEPERPYDWPPINTFQVGRGHGRNTMIGAIRSNLIVTKRQETYAFGFNKFPGFGQDFQINNELGCVSNRTFDVDEDGTGRWLDVKGIAESNGERVRIISTPIAEKFQEIIFDGDLGDLAPRAVAVHDIINHEYICAIPTALAANGVGCREIIVYNYRTRVWSIFKLEVEITAFSRARDESGYPIILVGDENGHVWRWGIGDTDGVGLPGNTGTLRGQVDIYNTSPGNIFIQDTDANFFKGLGSPNLDIKGVMFRVTRGTGAGQIAPITNQEFSPSRLFFENQFPVALDATSAYQLGTIEADHVSGWTDYGLNRIKYLEAMEVSYYIEDDPADWFLELFIDQPGVVTPVIHTFANGKVARFKFSTDGSDEPVPSGKTSESAKGFVNFKTGNLPFRLLQWRLHSPYSGAPGTYFTVTPVLRPGDN